MLILYGADLSCPSNKVRYVAHLCGLEYEYRRVSIKKGENRTPDYLKMHPAGKIPSLDDNGFVVFESNTIIRYLADKAGSGLYPSSRQDRALVEQWLDFVSFHIGGAMDRVAFNRIFAPLIKVEADQKSLETGLMFLNRFLPVVENRLAQHLFLAGRELSLADIGLLANLDACELARVEVSPYPRLCQWRNSLRHQEFYTRCHTVYGERLEKILGDQQG